MVSTCVARALTHNKTKDGVHSPIERHHRLDNFAGQLQLCVFGFHTKIVEAEAVTGYRGKRGDSVIFLDSRSLPEQVGVYLGLLETGAFGAMLPSHPHADVRLVHFATNTIPWIYVKVEAVGRWMQLTYDQFSGTHSQQTSSSSPLHRMLRISYAKAVRQKLLQRNVFLPDKAPRRQPPFG